MFSARRNANHLVRSHRDGTAPQIKAPLTTQHDHDLLILVRVRRANIPSLQFHPRDYQLFASSNFAYLGLSSSFCRSLIQVIKGHDRPPQFFARSTKRRDFSQGIISRKRAPTSSMGCFSPSASSRLKFGLPFAHSSIHSSANLPD